MPKLDLDSIEQTNRTGYPAPFDARVQGRWYRRLAPAGGLTAGCAGGLSAALAAFHEDLGSLRDEVTVVTMSEFGRTIGVNGSGGTDHGRASALFVMGGKVNGGLYGDYPSGALEDGPEGDLEVQNDFRRPLAEILTKRLGNPALSTVFPGYTHAGDLGLCSA